MQIGLRSHIVLIPRFLNPRQHTCRRITLPVYKITQTLSLGTTISFWAGGMVVITMVDESHPLDLPPLLPIPYVRSAGSMFESRNVRRGFGGRGGGNSEDFSLRTAGEMFQRGCSQFAIIAVENMPKRVTATLRSMYEIDHDMFAPKSGTVLC